MMDVKLYPALKTAAELIRAEIAACSIISFARFMELALYHPETGYYEKSAAQIGRRGDFYTSVSVGPLFGELLAFRFARWLENLSGNAPVQIVEAGAHSGQLAADILTALQKREPALMERLQYWIIEPSPVRQRAQAATLQGIPLVRWFCSLEQAGEAAVNGLIFSNELLDAMPVHVFAWKKATREWEEMGVTTGMDHRFLLAPMPSPSVAPPDLPAPLLQVLPDAYTVEVSPAAVKWWTQAATVLHAGRLLTIDYGGKVEELLNPGRISGTVRGYAKHRITNALDRPGEQDITAHVNFTELEQAGERAALGTEAYTLQGPFLTSIFREFWRATGCWAPEQTRQFQTLTHPEHLGRPFRVLVQKREEQRERGTQTG